MTRITAPPTASFPRACRYASICPWQSLPPRCAAGTGNASTGNSTTDCTEDARVAMPGLRPTLLHTVISPQPTR